MTVPPRRANELAVDGDVSSRWWCSLSTITQSHSDGCGQAVALARRDRRWQVRNSVAPWSWVLIAHR